MMVMNMLGEYIKYMRTSRGYTQGELCKRIYIATSTLSHYETGLRLVPYHIFLLVAKVCEYEINVFDCLSGKEITEAELQRISNI